MPQPNSESPAWEEDQFDQSVWHDWYGEGATECAEVFDIYMHLQTRYQRAERRANLILEQDELDIVSVRDYVMSIYEQSEQGLVDEDGLTYGRDSRGRRFSRQDVNAVLNDLPKYEDGEFLQNEVTEKPKSRVVRFLEMLGKRRIRFI